MSWRVIHADCLEAMAEMEEASVDAIVTDPPYGLEFMGKEWDRLLWDDSGDKQRAEGYVGSDGVSRRKTRPIAAGMDTPRFAGGKTAQQWHEAWATAALRVLKPGGHLLAFGGTRTYHRLACAIEDAGFEIRDCLAWMYGSGFPKSLDVSKAIDKARDDKPEARTVAAFLRTAMEGQYTADQVDAHFGWSHTANNYIRTDLGRTPPWDRWLQLKELLGFGDEMDAEVWRLNGRKGKPGENWEHREIIGPRSGSYGYQDGERWAKEHYPTAPATPEAQRWQGWGTALKPAHEPIVLARKPLVGSVAQNVQRYGVGALNIDGTRIDPGSEVPGGGGWAAHQQEQTEGWERPYVNGADPTAAHSLGRWPANVVLDPEAAALLDEQTGETGSGSGVRRQAGPGAQPFNVERGWNQHSMTRDGAHAPEDYGDRGGASRFFYCPKADREERDRGLEHRKLVTLETHGEREQGPLAQQTPQGPIRARNPHPTVKPVELMRWLCRLVTPPGGLILDPFTGSGSTGIAALREGFNFVGIEREADYVEIARDRIRGDAPLFNVAAEVGADV